MTIYRGMGGVNREIKQQFRGVGGVNREIKEQYRGVGGVNRQVFNSFDGTLYSDGDKWSNLNFWLGFTTLNTHYKYSKNANNFYIYGYYPDAGDYGCCCVGFDNNIDLTKYNYINIEISNCVGTDSFNLVVYSAKPTSRSGYGSWVKQTYVACKTGTVTGAIDVSTLNGMYFIGVAAQGGVGKVASGYIKKIWLS